MCIHLENNTDCFMCRGTGRRNDGYEDFGPCPNCLGSGCNGNCPDCDETEEE